MRKKGTSKFLIVLNSLLLLLLVSVGVFAVWDSLREERSKGIAVGVGLDLTVTESVSITGTLIPVGNRLGVGEVNEIELIYTVSINKNLAADATLNVRAVNKLIGGQSENSNLVKVKIEPSSTTIKDKATSVTVKVTVTLTEPSSQEIYDAVAGKVITFDLIFEIPNA